MDPFTLALLGSTAISGIGGLLGSKKADKAQRKALAAAQNQLRASRDAAAGHLSTGYSDAMGYAGSGRDESMRYAGEGRDAAIDARLAYLDPALAEFTPIIESGDRARTAYETATGLLGREAQQGYYDDFLHDPGFEAEVDFGLRALDRSAAARGGMAGGNHLAALTRYGQTMQRDAFNNRLSQINQLRTSGDAARTASATMRDSAGRDIAGYHDNYGRTASGIAGDYGRLTAGLASGYGAGMADLERGFGDSMAGGYLQGGQLKANNAMAPYNAMTNTMNNALRAYGSRLGSTPTTVGSSSNPWMPVVERA